jgi:hypothetical protein
MTVSFDDDDIEICGTPCPSCGCDHTATRICYQCNGEGFRDVYEDDLLWYDEGDIEDCRECASTGSQHWCRNCGYDFAFKRRICAESPSEEQA